MIPKTSLLTQRLVEKLFEPTYEKPQNVHEELINNLEKFRLSVKLDRVLYEEGLLKIENGLFVENFDRKS